MDQKLFSVRRALDNDFSLSMPLMIPLIGWVIYLLPLVFVGRSAFFFYLAIAATLAGPLIVWWQVKAIRSVFEQGQLAPGVIRSTQFIRDRGRINYNYRYAGELYTGTVTVHVTDHSKSFQTGQEVEVVVNPGKPQQAYLRKLYI